MIEPAGRSDAVADATGTAAPSAVPAARRQPRKSAARRAIPWVIGFVVLFFGTRTALRLWQERQTRLPAGIAVGNGRLEADEIDIATKFPGRVAELFVAEGERVRAGRAAARMDTRDLEAEQRTAQAQVQQAMQAVDESRAMIEQQRAQVDLTRKELDRYRTLRARDFVSQEDLDQRQQAYDGAAAALNAVIARAAGAQHALDGARHVVELHQVNIADDTLRVPRDGLIQYRLANVGEVLGAGGKVFTMLDGTSVYMDIFLPTAESGQLRSGSDARIALDAYPGDPLPAHISFLAGEAQFTPKAVETKSERDKLMFRVRVRVDTQFLRSHEGDLRTGVPGVAYVRLDTTVAWPSSLQPRASDRPTQ